MTEFAKKVKTLMSEKNINQKELSKMSGVSEATLCRYLKGDSTPRLDIVINVSKALGVNETYLLGGENNQNQGNPYVETRNIIMRNRSDLSDTEKLELLKLLFGDK
jgi:transcriptional regulator with XRE-family HTH domain